MTAVLDRDHLLVGLSCGGESGQVIENGAATGGQPIVVQISPGHDARQAGPRAVEVQVGAEEVSGDPVEVPVPADVIAQVLDQPGQVRDVLELRFPCRSTEVLRDLCGTAGRSKADLVEEALRRGRVDGDGPVVPLDAISPRRRHRARDAKAQQHELHLVCQLLGCRSQSDGRGGVNPAVALEQCRQEGSLCLVTARADDVGDGLVVRCDEVEAVVATQHLAQSGRLEDVALLVVVAAHLHPREVLLDQRQVLGRDVGVLVREADLVRAAQCPLRNEVAEQDGQSLTDPVA